MKIIFFTIKCILLISLTGVVSKSIDPKQITTRDLQIRVDENMAMLLQNLYRAEYRSSDIQNAQTKDEMDKRFKYLEKQISTVSQDTLKEVIRICRSTNTFYDGVTNCTKDPSSKIMDKFGPLYLKVDNYIKDVQLHLDNQSKINEPYQNKLPDRMIG